MVHVGEYDDAYSKDPTVKKNDPTPQEIDAAIADIQEDWSPIQERHARNIHDCDVEKPVPTYKILTVESNSRRRLN